MLLTKYLWNARIRCEDRIMTERTKVLLSTRIHSDSSSDERCSVGEQKRKTRCTLPYVLRVAVSSGAPSERFSQVSRETFIISGVGFAFIS